MSTISSLFGRTPFAPLESHMKIVTRAVLHLPELFEKLEANDQKGLLETADKISELEHMADLTKNDIRNNLPKSLFLPIDRSSLLEILALQDSLADRAEDVAVLVGMKELQLPEKLAGLFRTFLEKNLAAFDEARKIIREMHELLESSFGGTEAERVREMVEKVATREHEADLIQRELMKTLLGMENEISYTTFYLWQKIFQAVGHISNLSENLAFRVRTTLELK